LAFHDWFSTALGTEPADLGTHIDWLFNRGTALLAELIARQQADRGRVAAEQLAPYRGRGFPEPGEDPALEALISQELAEWLTSLPPVDSMRRLIQRIRGHLTQENKRKNLVGEGFEDVLANLIRRLPGAEEYNVMVRPLLHSIHGFRPPPRAEKPRRVDLAIIGPGDDRNLISVKWSVRADREEQFGVDFEAYARLEDAGRDFAFTLITNEFDAARLTKACDRRRQNAYLFSSVVHVNTNGPLAAYGKEPKRSAANLEPLIQSGRLESLEQWLSKLT
jgi:hypothetical protein